MGKQDQKKFITLLLCLPGLFMVAGLHYFYIGKYKRGLLYLFTGGLFYVGTIIDIVKIANGSFEIGNRVHSQAHHNQNSSSVHYALQENYVSQISVEPRKKTHETLVLPVAGVTFKNDDGTSRQAILRKKYREEEKDGLFPVVSLEVYEHEGEDAIAVNLDDLQVGNVQRRHIQDVLEIINSGKKVIGLTCEIESFEDEDNKKIWRCDVFVEYKP